jgi:diacylglycerol kinase (ATP)
VTPERVGAVVNPASGGGDAAALFADLAGCFPDATVDARITTGPDDVQDATVEQARWADLVVVIGGDGTLRESAAALFDADLGTPMFVVPAGRGNSSYRHLYGETEWRQTARALADGVDPRPLEVGRVDSTPAIEHRYFVLGFTAGLFRRALETAEWLRGVPGTLSYLLATVGATVDDDPVDVTVAVDGDRLFDGEARLVGVGGGRYRGSDFELLPDSRPGDGRLHALVVEPTGIAASLRLLRLARAGRIVDHPAVRYRTGETATLGSDGGVPVELDGTPVDTSLVTARLSVVADAVMIAYPAGSGGGEPSKDS